MTANEMNNLIEKIRASRHRTVTFPNFHDVALGAKAACSVCQGMFTKIIEYGGIWQLCEECWGKTGPVPTSEAEWINKLAAQYGARQMASLRGNTEQYQAADLWLRMVANDHWHDIIAALRGVRPTSTYVNRCAHEWYQGRCTHCDIKAVDGRPEQPDKVGIAGKP